MRRTIPFLLALLTGLALLVLGGYFVLNRTTRAWFEHDLSLRAIFEAHSHVVSDRGATVHAHPTVRWGGSSRTF